MTNRAKPATLIIGAGIAGIQAALDMAEAGYKVYLVEKSGSIGGRMAQLYKTFPNLDTTGEMLKPRMEMVAASLERVAREAPQIAGMLVSLWSDDLAHDQRSLESTLRLVRAFVAGMRARGE